MSEWADISAELKRRRQEIEQRLDSLHASSMHTDAPLEADFAEQAIQRENDEVLAALESSGAIELRDIQRALARIESGDYGFCSLCGTEIPIERLRAVPYTDRCLDCAEYSSR